jgi:Hypothetical glycosyl hydrolase family 15
MSDNALTSHRIASSGRCRANKRPRVRLEVEVLEERTVPSYFPSTANGIHVFEDQLPGGLSNAMVQFLATNTDGTQKQTSSEIDQFRAINPDYTLLHYQLGTGNSPYDYIINDQWSSDWTYVNQQESWFAHQTYSGEPQSAADLSSGRVGNSTGWDQADIANPAWQQYTLNQVFQNMAATGANGWFADSFTYGISAGGYDGTIPTRYQGTNAANPADWPGAVTWTTQLGNWAQTIETAFAQHNATYGTDYQFIPNLDARVTSWEPNWYDNSSGVPIVDGAFLEGFGEYTDTYDWTLSMNRGLNLTDNNKIVIMQPYLQDTPDSATGQQERNFYLGTYLLLKGDETYLDIDYGGGAQYYPEYQLNLGAPTTSLPSNVSSYLWNGVYRRDFQNGFVLVNPGTTTYNLNLGGNFQEVQGHGGGTLTDAQLDANGNYIGGSLTYQNVSSITLAGGSAAIFLNPLTVTTPATPAANPVTGTSVGLKVLGQENGSDAGLTYTWSSSGPAGVGFSDNADNSAKNVTATFTQAGSYTLTATIADGSGQSVASSVVVTVNQTLTTIAVTPQTASVPDAATQQFAATATDQFGLAINNPAISWSLTGLGSLSAAGKYTAPASGTGSATVKASNGSVSTTAAVTVTLPPAFSYNASTQTLTITASVSPSAFTYSQATAVDASGTPHTTYSFTLNGATAFYTDSQLVRAIVNGQGIGNTAILITNDTYLSKNGATQETPERVSLGSRTDAGVGTISRFVGNSTSNASYTFLTLSDFDTSYAYVGRNDGTVLLYGTAGVAYNGFVSAGNYSYIGGPGLFHLAQGASSVYGYSAGQPADFAYHYTANPGSTFVVSGVAYSYMSCTDTVNGQTQSYFNVGVGFQENTGVSKNPGHDFAYIIDSPMNDTFFGGSTYSYMYSTDGSGNFTEFDTAYAFALIYAQSFVGGVDAATNNDPTHNILGGKWNLLM